MEEGDNVSAQNAEVGKNAGFSISNSETVSYRY